MIGTSGWWNIRAIIRKEIRQIKRDKRSLAILLLVPVFMLMMFGYALNFDVKHVPVAVLDLDQSSASRQLYRQLGNNEYLDICYQLENLKEVDAMLGAEKARVVMVIPNGFSGDHAAGRSPQVQFLIDGANANAATSTLGYLEAAISHLSTKIMTERRAIAGQAAIAASVDYRPRVWFNPELKSARFLIPGLMGFILVVVGVVSTSLSIVREKERGSLEQMEVSPVTPAEMVVGKTLPYAVIGLISTTMILALGAVLFDVQVKGSLLLFYVVTLTYIVGALGMGLLVSTIAETQQVAFMIAIITTMLPSYILSGFVFPIRNMPAAIQLITYAVPARYYLSCIRAIILKGAGLEALWLQLLALGAFAGVTLWMGAFRMGLMRKGSR